ncbi:hypothetical protein MPK71_gp286 [Erwinia phage pEa_SNUABM_1]|uniref:Uncharacterized protein n=1 Tax=Erwinia phage pEa_SNUABM_1 TaxID=2869543 RepID=A0AAE7XL13_9CAUD|nr:hypothetical protein MPK71_gp286 [Erwinia phage pEa_SNUABM_1]QZE57495.1 hypothetical protein pEaSNUABM1_00286 [Erwinia phage pEa_SNUABM_1]
MDNIIQFLMNDDEIHDALVAYRTDPTEENKRRVIETILNERESVIIASNKPAVPEKLPHRFVLVPTTDTIKSLRPEFLGKRSFHWVPGPDDQLAATAKQASAVLRHIHELGGSAVYVRFSGAEWQATFDRVGFNYPLREMKVATLETESLDAIADIMAKLIRLVGNMDDMAYSIRLIRQMYAVAENRHDDSVTDALIKMIDTSRTQNIPSICKEPEDENEEE